MNSNKENFIDSIYNYCDRWCERCEYTDRCRLYSMEIERKEEPGYDETNIELAKEIHRSFAETFKMIEEYAEKFGIDISQVVTVEKKEPEPTQLTFLATKYFKDASVYLKKLREEIKSNGAENAVLSTLIPQNPELINFLKWLNVLK